MESSAGSKKLQTCSFQGDGAMNEDALVINEREQIYAVIDGATSITSYRNEAGQTGGYIAARILASRLENVPAHVRLEDAVLQANQELHRTMAEAGVDVSNKSHLWSAAFVVFRVHPTYIEYAQAGDCMLFAQYEDGAVRTITYDQVAHVDRLLLVKRQEMAALGEADKAKQLSSLYPTISLNRQKANTLEGYSLMNGEENLKDYIETGRFNRACLTRLYAVTDGMFHCMNENDPYRVWKDMISQIDRNGLEAYASDLIQLEKEDSACRKYPRLKISDDKSGIVLDLA